MITWHYFYYKNGRHSFKTWSSGIIKNVSKQFWAEFWLSLMPVRWQKFIQHNNFYQIFCIYVTNEILPWYHNYISFTSYRLLSFVTKYEWSYFKGTSELYDYGQFLLAKYGILLLQVVMSTLMAVSNVEGRKTLLWKQQSKIFCHFRDSCFLIIIEVLIMLNENEVILLGIFFKYLLFTQTQNYIKDLYVRANHIFNACSVLYECYSVCKV